MKDVSLELLSTPRETVYQTELCEVASVWCLLTTSGQQSILFQRTHSQLL